MRLTVVGPRATCTQTFAYDARDRVIDEDNGAATNRNYDLDAASNVVRDTGGPRRRGDRRLLRRADGVAAAPGTQRTYSHYDDFGNLDCTATAEPDADAARRHLWLRARRA